MNSLKGSGGGHMKFLTFGTPLNKMKHPKARCKCDKAMYLYGNCSTKPEGVTWFYQFSYDTLNINIINSLPKYQTKQKNQRKLMSRNALSEAAST